MLAFCSRSPSSSRVAAIALDGLRVVALLLEHERLVEHGRGIVRPQLLRLLEQPQRIVELAARRR